MARTLGVLNLFFASNQIPGGIEPIAQAFSDIATVVILHSATISTTDIMGQLRSVLSDRVVINIDWFNHRRLHGELEHLPPAEVEANHYSEIPVLTEAGTT